MRHCPLHMRSLLLREWSARCRGTHNRSIYMNWVRAVASILILSSSPAWGATLTWNANTESDLAGYRVYQCSEQPCSRASGLASVLATVGSVTSFNIGTPTVTQYYFVTAYDSANNESHESNLATFTPTGSDPSSLGATPPAPGGLQIISVQ